MPHAAHTAHLREHAIDCALLDRCEAVAAALRDGAERFRESELPVVSVDEASVDERQHERGIELVGALEQQGRLRLAELPEPVCLTVRLKRFVRRRAGRIPEHRAGLLAMDARDGRVLYRFQTGGAVSGGVVTYAVGGKQYVAATSGSLPVFKRTNGSATIFVFALP